MALPQFINEAEFRTKWIAPFLSKLGYVLVKHIHGHDEQGKDFFFADYDLMEHRRFHAVQAKVGSIGAAQKELEALLNQIARCFTVRLRFHKDAHDRHVSSVYVMASGAISSQAREYISDWCDRQAFGENVFFLDGETLERLDKYAFQRVDRQLRNWLIAVWNECQFNEPIIAEAQGAFSDKKTIWNRCRHLAVEQLLVNPPPEDIMTFGLLQGAWVALSRLNKVCDYHLLPMSTTDEQWQDRVNLASNVLGANRMLLEAAALAIRKLDERYSVSVEVLE